MNKSSILRLLVIIITPIKNAAGVSGMVSPAYMLAYNSANNNHLPVGKASPEFAISRLNEIAH